MAMTPMGHVDEIKTVTFANDSSFTINAGGSSTVTLDIQDGETTNGYSFMGLSRFKANQNATFIIQVVNAASHSIRLYNFGDQPITVGATNVGMDCLYKKD